MKPIGDKEFSELLIKRISEGQDPHGVTRDLFHLMSAKDPSTWFQNHPIISTIGGKTLMSVAPKVLKLLLMVSPNMKGVTKVLINKLIINKIFLGMFITNPGFQKASLEALDDYNNSIEQGTTGKSKSQQL